MYENIRLFIRKILNKQIIIVSGLPRSGTSMMMRILEAGGIEPLTDGIREADVNNPGGYYEFERVKKLPDGNIEWLKHAEGKAVKIIASLVPHLPPRYNYKIIFMKRAMDEILASQKDMLSDRDKDVENVNEQKLRTLYNKHISEVLYYMEEQSNIKFIEVDYSGVVKNPREQMEGIEKFVEVDMDIDDMVDVVNPKLYKHRSKHI